MKVISVLLILNLIYGLYAKKNEMSTERDYKKKKINACSELIKARITQDEVNNFIIF